MSMKTTIIISSILGAMMLTSGLIMIFNHKKTAEDHIDIAWDHWKMTNGRLYGTSSDETYRKQIFVENYHHVKNTNSQKRSFTLGLNKFADITTSEFKQKYLTLQTTQKQANVKHIDTSLLKSSGSRDWVADGAVTSVKEQGLCGACWAISAAAALEGLAYLETKQLMNLSEQQMIDCATWEKYQNKGCHGGFMDNGFKYSADNGMMQSADYPFTAEDGKCAYDASKKITVNSGYSDVPLDDNDQLVAAIENQPTSTGIAADYLQLYMMGVFDEWDYCKGDKLNHGVLAVGYGTDSDTGKLFYKVKNSWGEEWGEYGYFRLERREGPGEGLCGITKQASYPTK